MVARATDFDFVVTATDSLGVTASGPLSVRVNPAPEVLTTALPIGTSLAAYTAPLTAGGGTGALAWSQSNFPSWLTLNASTGVISGTPPTPVNLAITVMATDSLAIASPPATLALKIDEPGGSPQITTLCPFSPTTAGLNFRASLSAAGGYPPYNWSVDGLPSWLTLTPDGTLSGTAVAGSAVFTLALSDSHSQTAALGCGLMVNPAPAITAASLPPGTVAAPYAQRLNAFGGTGKLIWSSQNLPGWLTIEPLTGLLSGTPSVSGNYSFTLQVTDSLGAISAAAPFTVAVTGVGGSPILTSCPLPMGSVGTTMSFQLTAALGFPPYAWSVNNLPAGFSATDAGLLTGTPSIAAVSAVGLSVTDSAGITASATCSLSISADPAVTTATLPDGTVGAFYWQQLEASGGVGPLQWSLSGAPVWMSLDPLTGILSGTPDSAGVGTFAVQVTDSQGTQSPPAQLSVNVSAPGGSLAITSACPLPAITQTMLLDQVFTADGGAPPYTWTATGLPAGVFLDPSGALLGGPKAGTIAFSVQATDQQQQQTAALSCSVAVNPPPVIGTAALPDAIAGLLYSTGMTVTGGTGQRTWSTAAPYWLSIDPPSGTLSGTPPAAGPVSAVVRVSDANGVSNLKTYAFTVAAPSASDLPALTSGCPLPGATVGAPYTYNLTAGGGTAPYQFFVSGLPAGMTFSSSGAISGAAQASGVDPLVVEVIDSNGNTATTSCGLTVSSTSTLSITANTPGGKVDQSYSGGFSAAGGVAPYAWSISAGSLPPGISLTATTGVLGGTPTASGNFPFTIAVTYRNQAIGSAIVAISIAPALQITGSPNLPDASAGSAYQYTLTQSGASGTLTWSIAAGTLPAGLTLNSATGVISGSATQGGTFTFTVQAVDGSGATGQLQVILNVDLPAIPQITIGGFPVTLTPDQQLTPTLTMAGPYPLDITGALVLSDTADTAIGFTDPAVQFASGGTTVPFAIPANSTSSTKVTLPALQTGTLAGTLMLNVTVKTGGETVQPPASAAVTGQIPELAPVIVGTPTVTVSGSTIQVTLTAFATSRSVTSGVFQFSGTNLATSSVTVPLSSLVGAWYSSASSDAYGSLFQIVQPFTVAGSASQITGVTITLTNAIGNSLPVNVQF